MNLQIPNPFRVPALPLFLLASLVVCCASVSAQSDNNNRGRNNPYSPSPSRRAKTAPLGSAADPNEAAFIMQSGATADADNRLTIAQRTYKIAKAADLRAMPPTDVYKVGVGDVLFINLKNAAQGSGYHTVRQDGTIDFPLAGEELIVAGQTVDDIEETLASHITLYPDPQVEVKIREYGSHKVTVSGLVDDPGEKNLQREAIPLYVIKAEAIVSPRAAKVFITRAPLLKLETYDLHDANTDNILVYPGNAVEFAADQNLHTGVYFISGNIVSSGQKDLISGMTLYQAIAAAGGGKGSPKKAVIRRKNESGMFTVFSHDLRAIKDGKVADPLLVSGDVVEIRN
jgi:protein involved in polysaccharide export with SLBB domain